MSGLAFRSYSSQSFANLLDRDAFSDLDQLCIRAVEKEVCNTILSSQNPADGTFPTGFDRFDQISTDGGPGQPKSATSESLVVNRTQSASVEKVEVNKALAILKNELEYPAAGRRARYILRNYRGQGNKRV